MTIVRISENESRDVNPDGIEPGDFVIGNEDNRLYEVYEVNEPMGYLLVENIHTKYVKYWQSFFKFAIREMSLLAGKCELTPKEAIDIEESLITAKVKGKL